MRWCDDFRGGADRDRRTGPVVEVTARWAGTAVSGRLPFRLVHRERRHGLGFVVRAGVLSPENRSNELKGVAITFGIAAIVGGGLLTLVGAWSAAIAAKGKAARTSPKQTSRGPHTGVHREEQTALGQASSTRSTAKMPMYGRKARIAPIAPMTPATGLNCVALL